MSRKANLSAAARRRGAEPSMAQLRAQIMAGEHRAAPKAAAKPTAAPKLPATLPVALPADVEAERQRITALHGLSAQAERMGLIGFDLTAAVASGTPVSKIRAALLDDAVARSDAVGEVAAYATQSAFGTADHGGMTDARKRAAFAKGLRANASGGIRPE